MQIDSTLAAFKIDRNQISVAIFIDDRLDFTDRRQFQSIYEKAIDSAKGFVEWLISAFPIDSAAVEKSHKDPETLRSRLKREIVRHFRSIATLVSEVEQNTVIASFPHPPPRHRTELRKAVLQIWPILGSKETQTSRVD